MNAIGAAGFPPVDAMLGSLRGRRGVRRPKGEVGTLLRTRVRSVAGAALAGLLIAAGVVTGSAAADTPPPVWTDAPGFPIEEADYRVSFLTAETTEDPFGWGYSYADVLPLWLPQFTNRSSRTLVLGLGIDLASEGVVEPLWEADSWGIFAEDGLHPGFRIEIAPGESLTQIPSSGLPRWPGHTGAIYLLDESQDPVVVTEIARYTAPGGFVPIYMDLPAPDASHLPQIGEQLRVVGPTGGAQIFPGLTAVATASGLTPGEAVELWIAPNFDYFFFHLLGAVLPSGARQVGTGVVAADGTLTATFGMPADLVLNVEGGAEVATPYQLIAGVRAESYWPAGTWGGFDVLPLSGLESASTEVDEGAQAVGLDVGSSLIELGSLNGLPAMTFTATANATGPSVSGFTLAGDSALFYHLSASAPLTGPVELCITYDQLSIPGPPPRLYHYVEVAPGTYEWTDITVTVSVGQVCGLTTSFSPFALGYPDPFDFSGFFEPVSNPGPNVAKAGQSIPVKFSLAGDQGLDVVTAARFVVEGTVLNPAGELLDAATAGMSGLSYDAAADRYTYVWKTQRAWALKTGTFVLELSDGTTHEFDVSFRK